MEQTKQQVYREIFNLPRNMIFKIMLKYQFALKTNTFETNLGRPRLVLCCLYYSVLESKIKQNKNQNDIHILSVTASFLCSSNSLLNCLLFPSLMDAALVQDLVTSGPKRGFQT